jgi:hypothetical protein
MISISKILSAILLVTVAAPFCNSQANIGQQSTFSAKPIQHGEETGDLVRILAFIAGTFKVSVLGELAQPYPNEVRVPAGRHTLEQTMNLVIQQCPEYRWRSEDGTLWVYRKSLLDARANFLNLRLKVFRMPDNLGDLKRFLPMDIQVAEGKGGGVTAGGPTPDQTSAKLSPEVFKNISVRDALIRAATEQKVFCLFLFPNGNPTTEAEGNDALGSWFLTTVDSLATTPPYLRSMPVARQN